MRRPGAARRARSASRAGRQPPEPAVGRGLREERVVAHGLGAASATARAGRVSAGSRLDDSRTRSCSPGGSVTSSTLPSTGAPSVSPVVEHEPVRQSESASCPGRAASCPRRASSPVRAVSSRRRGRPARPRARAGRAGRARTSSSTSWTTYCPGVSGSPRVRSAGCAAGRGLGRRRRVEADARLRQPAARVVEVGDRSSSNEPASRSASASAFVRRPVFRRRSRRRTSRAARTRAGSPWAAPGGAATSPATARSSSGWAAVVAAAKSAGATMTGSSPGATGRSTPAADRERSAATHPRSRDCGVRRPARARGPSAGRARGVRHKIREPSRPRWRPTDPERGRHQGCGGRARPASARRRARAGGRRSSPA